MGSLTPVSGQVDIEIASRYRLESLVARGGMAEVWEGYDRLLDRAVAVKMPLVHLREQPEFLQRFQREAVAAAQLQHPNIVQIYEIGDQDGRPYFSLEFVDGGSLAGQLNGVPQTPHHAAELVETLALAMEAAHRLGLIHRDLKPANILMTQTGIPKITDFGLAKRLNEDSGQTGSGVVMGTPSYMAPEQAKGQINLLGPAADIYSLGAILYETLTGRPPFRGATVLETLEQVLQDEPVPPSRLQPKVPRDLETICLKCLNKEPPKRYTSAQEMADDLRRFLNNEPIHARPITTLERGMKWVRRRPTLAALYAVVLLILLAVPAVIVAFSQVQAAHEHQRAEEQAQQAETERGLKDKAVAAEQLAKDNETKAKDNEQLAKKNEQLAKENETKAKDSEAKAKDNFLKADENLKLALDAVNQMLTEVGQEQLANLPGMEEVRRDLLDQAAVFYQNLAQKKTLDPKLTLKGAEAYLRVGDIQKTLGDNARAEAAYKSAAEVLTQLQGPLAADRDFQTVQGTYYNNQGNLYQDTGRPQQAEEAYDQALKVRKQLAKDVPQEPRYQEQLAATFNNVGNLWRDRDPKKAIEAYQQAIDLQDKLVKNNSQNHAYWQQLARSYNNLGNVLTVVGPFEQAQANIEKAKEIFQNLANESKDVPDYRRELAVSYNHLANLWRDRDPAQSETNYQAALALEEDLTKFSKLPIDQQDLAGTYNNLGLLYQGTGRTTLAKNAFRHALAVKQQLLADVPGVAGFQEDLAKSYNNWGLLLQSQGQQGDEADLAAAAAASAALGGSPMGAGSFSVAATLAKERSDTALAYGKALDLLVQLTARSPMDEKPDYWHELGRTRLNMGTLEEAHAHPQEAEEYYRQAEVLLNQLNEKFPDRPQYREDLGRAHLDLGLLLMKNHLADEAGREFRDAVTLFSGLTETFPQVHDYRYELALSQQNQAFLLERGNQIREAEAGFGEALKRFQTLVQEGSLVPSYRQEMARTYHELGICQGELGRLDEARTSFQKALNLQETLANEALGKPEAAQYQQELARTCNNLGLLEAAQNHSADAQAHHTRAIQLLRKLKARYPYQPAYWQDDLIDGYTYLGRLLSKAGTTSEAESYLAQAEALSEARIAAFPSNGDYLKELIGTLNDLAKLEMQLRKPAVAQQYLQKAGQYQRAAMTRMGANPSASRELLLAQVETQVLSGDHRAAAKNILSLTHDAPPDWSGYPRAAGLLANCIVLAQNDRKAGKLSDNESRNLIQDYGTQAVQLLEKAVAAGFNDQAYLKSPIFDPIRARSDFQGLLQKLEAPAKTTAE